MAYNVLKGYVIVTLLILSILCFTIVRLSSKSEVKYTVLSVTSHISCIVARCLINLVCLRNAALSGYDDVALFE